MQETRTSQTELARITGVHQPTISQFLSGRIDFSDDQLGRLLAAMGYRLDVVRTSVAAEMSVEERRSWRLHRRIAGYLNADRLEQRRRRIVQDLDRRRAATADDTVRRQLDRWASLIDTGDLRGLRRVSTGVDPESIAMRTVSPFADWLSVARRTGGRGANPARRGAAAADARPF